MILQSNSKDPYVFWLREVKKTSPENIINAKRAWGQRNTSRDIQRFFNKHYSIKEYEDGYKTVKCNPKTF